MIKILIALLILSVTTAYSQDDEASNDDIISSIKQEDAEKDLKEIFVEVPILGNGIAPVYPSRVIAFKICFERKAGVLLEPILGYNLFSGFGASAGFFFVHANTHYDMKGIIYNVSKFGVAKEVYFDIDHYFKFTRKHALKIGGGIGVGIDKISEDESDGITTRTFETGATFRLHLDYSLRMLL